jgi:hypothetical protein
MPMGCKNGIMLFARTPSNETAVRLIAVLTASSVVDIVLGLEV